MNRRRHNPPAPPWAHKAVKANWPALAAKGLPLPRDSKDAYGCGHYGCVYPTTDPGVVFKVTSDPTEAFFVGAARAIGEQPDGIVRYDGIYRMKGAYRRRPIYALWRQAAEYIGGIVDIPGRKPVPGGSARYYTFLRGLTHFLYTAGEFRNTFKSRPSFAKAWAELARWRDWAWRNIGIEDVPGGSNTEGWLKILRRTRGQPAQRLAATLRISEILAELMAHSEYSDAVGRALEFYIEHDLLLADVHHNNIGLVEHPDYSRPIWVITDPGHAVALSPRWAEVQVEEL